jgi:hypothetical protein
MQQYIVNNLDNPEDIPFQITQVIQNAFRNTNIRMVASSTEQPARLDSRFFQNQQQIRQREQEE